MSSKRSHNRIVLICKFQKTFSRVHDYIYVENRGSELEKLYSKFEKLKALIFIGQFPS